jgi:hypothetical protein
MGLENTFFPDLPGSYKSISLPGWADDCGGTAGQMIGMRYSGFRMAAFLAQQNCLKTGRLERQANSPIRAKLAHAGWMTLRIFHTPMKLLLGSVAPAFRRC